MPNQTWTATQFLICSFFVLQSPPTHPLAHLHSAESVLHVPWPEHGVSTTAVWQVLVSQRAPLNPSAHEHVYASVQVALFKHAGQTRFVHPLPEYVGSQMHVLLVCNAHVPCPPLQSPGQSASQFAPFHPALQVHSLKTCFCKALLAAQDRNDFV